MYIIISYLLVINAVSFSLMYIDKRRAINHKYRISEKMLWTVSLLGGATGSFAGMRLVRHKSKHFSFKYGLPVLIICQFVILYIIYHYATAG